MNNFLKIRSRSKLSAKITEFSTSNLMFQSIVENGVEEVAEVSKTLLKEAVKLGRGRTILLTASC